MLMAIRLALVCGSDLLVPASSYFENECCSAILSPFRPFAGLGMLWLVGRGENHREFCERKLSQYRSNRAIYRRYKYWSNQMELDLPWLSRSTSPTKVITSHWESSQHRLEELVPEEWLVEHPTFDQRWGELPAALDGQAFVLDNIVPILDLTSLEVVSSIHRLVNRAYFESFISELDAGLFRSLLFLRSSALPRTDPKLDFPYLPILKAAENLGIRARIATAPANELIRMALCDSDIANLRRFLHHGFYDSSNSKTWTGPPMDEISVFISHSSKDVKLAAATVKLISSALLVNDGEIRCTSVPGYKLRGGDDPETLRRNIQACRVFVGIITIEALRSGFVLMEMGAAWAFKKRVCLLLEAGLAWTDIPGPFKPKHSVKADDREGVVEFLEGIEAAGFGRTKRLAKFDAAVTQFLSET